ncbi:MAG: PilZ domain-containing protein [Peptostreptococcaceae bacterium]|nr:PilZ domain-containing protein [Peptostreptococcaceae bacterium]
MGNIVESNVDETRNFNAFGSDGTIIAIGNLDYIGEKISVFSTSEFIGNKRSISGYIRIESKVNYEDVYSAMVDRVENNKIFLASLRNISDELKEDIKVDFRRDIRVTYTDGEKEQSVEARLTDISSGGVGLVCKKSFGVGQTLRIDTEILGIGSLLNVQTLRREIMGRVYKYGCRFVELNSREESAIRRAVYRLQIEEHRSRYGRG